MRLADTTLATRPTTTAPCSTKPTSPSCTGRSSRPVPLFSDFPNLKLRGSGMLQGAVVRTALSCSSTGSPSRLVRATTSSSPSAPSPKHRSYLNLLFPDPVLIVSPRTQERQGPDGHQADLREPNRDDPSSGRLSLPLFASVAVPECGCFEAAAQASWRVETPNKGDCFLGGTTNVFGRLLNGVPDGEECFRAAKSTGVTGTGLANPSGAEGANHQSLPGKFIQVEQAPEPRDEIEPWTKAISAAIKA